MQAISDTIVPMATPTTSAPTSASTATPGTPGTSGRGRPREFDLDAVLDRVVELFWEKGFEATSVNDIVDATGLNKSSLYNAFGSKDALFERALEKYMAMRISMLTAMLTDGTAGLDDIEALMQFMELELTSDAGGRGCLAVNTSTELGYRDDAARAASNEYRTAIRAALTAVLTRAEARGEIEPGSSATYVEVLLPWMLGMAVVARSGAEADEVARYFAAGRALITGWRLNSPFS